MADQKISARALVTVVPAAKIPIGTASNEALTPAQIVSLVIPGIWNASTNAFPTEREDGGSITRGYQFDNIGDSTTLFDAQGGIIYAGAVIRALIDDPGQDVANWKITYG